MSSENIYHGSCFCGSVQFTVSGEPTAMGYCHCESCRHWSAGPVNAFSLWKPDAIQMSKSIPYQTLWQQWLQVGIYLSAILRSECSVT